MRLVHQEWATRGLIRRRLRRAGAAVLAVALLAASAPAPASAVTVPILAAPTSVAVNATATYAAQATTTKNNERITVALYTFPANTSLAGVTAATCSAVEQGSGQVYPITSVVVDQAALTVTVNINFPRDRPVETFTVSVGGVVNPSQPGAGYSYSCALTSDKTAVMTGTRAYTLTAPATAVTVGTVALTTPTGAQNAGYTVPITLGALGRLAGTTAAGANTVSITFPADTVVPASPPAGSVTIGGVAPATVAVNAATRQVTLTLPAGQTLAGGSTFNVVFDPAFGLVNPTTGGNYTLTARTSAQTGAATSPGYAVTLDYLTMTIDTASVDFGAVDPGVTSGPRAVNVTVSSSAPVTITRAISGDAGPLGLSVTGAAVGVKPAGLATYADSFTITPPWTTDPDVALLATVAYTAIQ